jgi:hypothetical protein
MRGEHAVLPDGFHVVVGDGSPSGTLGVLVQECQGEQAGMALVHMKARDVAVAERPEHAHPAYAQQPFLA